MIYELWITVSVPRVASSNPRVTSSGPQATSSKAQIKRLKV